VTSKLIQANTAVYQNQDPLLSAPNTLEALLNERDIAHITGMSLATVRRWRLSGHGPRATKIGAAVRYKPEDLKAWLDSRPTIGGGQLLEARQ
jgi:predicted DNA-binding transcriptional regulator AlpA